VTAISEDTANRLLQSMEETKTACNENTQACNELRLHQNYLKDEVHALQNEVHGNNGKKGLRYEIGQIKLMLEGIISRDERGASFKRSALIQMVGPVLGVVLSGIGFLIFQYFMLSGK